MTIELNKTGCDCGLACACGPACNCKAAKCDCGEDCSCGASCDCTINETPACHCGG